jgi:hypothetical protein
MNIKLYPKANLNFNRPRTVLLYNSATSKCDYGLAIGACGESDINYNNITRLEYWIGNKAPATALGGATYVWANAGSTSYSALSRVLCGKAKLAQTTSYSGATPFTTATTSLSNVNVIRIGGSLIV